MKYGKGQHWGRQGKGGKAVGEGGDWGLSSASAPNTHNCDEEEVTQPLW